MKTHTYRAVVYSPRGKPLHVEAFAITTSDRNKEHRHERAIWELGRRMTRAAIARRVIRINKQQQKEGN